MCRGGAGSGVKTGAAAAAPPAAEGRAYARRRTAVMCACNSQKTAVRGPVSQLLRTSVVRAAPLHRPARVRVLSYRMP